MTHRQPDLPDAPACPFLGLEADSRTRFTFPHPGHRCHAARGASTIDLARQSGYCLSSSYPACERFRAQLPRPAKSAGAPAPAPAPARSTQTVVHVFRAGDSLARIASAYGIAVEQLLAANNLKGTAAVVDGQRLLIPLGPGGPARPAESGSAQAG